MVECSMRCTIGAVDDIFDYLIKSKFTELFGTIDLSMQASDWVPLKNIGIILTGSTPKTNVSAYWDGDIKWIAPAEISDESFIINDTKRKITLAGRDSCSLNLLKPGVVLLSSRAPIGKVAIVGSDMYCNQGFKNIECGSGLNNIFLYTLLKYNKTYLNSLGRGATFKEISANIVGDIKIPVPDIEKQSLFAEYFQHIYDIRTVMKKMVVQYDELIESIFIEMFGDFIRGKSCYDLVKINELCTNKPSTIQIKDMVGHEGHYPLYGASGVVMNIDSYMVDSDYIGIIKDGAGVGRVMHLPGKSSIVGTMTCLCPNEQCDITYLENSLKMMDLGSGHTGTTIPHIYYKDFGKRKIPLAPLCKQKEFANIVRRINILKRLLLETAEKMIE